MLQLATDASRLTQTHRIWGLKCILNLCSTEHKSGSELDKSCTGEDSMGSKVMGSLQGLFLWFPTSHGLGFANEHAGHREIHQTRSCGTPSLRYAQDSRTPSSNFGISPAMTPKNPFQPTFSDIKDLGKRVFHF